MIYNFHTHTFRCSHANGTEEEYVKKAIENGIKYLGFSDHFPYIFPDGHMSSFRVPASAVQEHIAEINRLKEKYNGIIDIKIGFEMEYYPEYFDDMLEKAKNYGTEYLILGQHYVVPENKKGVHTNTQTDSAEFLNKYVASVVSAMYKGVFTYVAHPDMLNFTGNPFIYRDAMRKICIASRETRIPLELNLLGILENRNYPNDIFWQLAGEEKSPVVFGYDSHNISNAFDRPSKEKAKQIVQKYDLNYIGMPNIILIK